MEAVTVTNFKPNDANLLAVVVCEAVMEENVKFFVELILKKNDEGLNLYLEEVSAPV